VDGSPTLHPSPVLAPLADAVRDDIDLPTAASHTIAQIALPEIFAAPVMHGSAAEQ